jgi:hypothetical protein
MQNYGTLKSFIADFLARDDLTSQIGTFITLTEQRMSRELDIALLERTTQSSVSAGQQFVSLPTDLRSIREVAYVDGGTRQGLHYLSPSQLDERKRSTTTDALAFYSITANELELLAPPSKALTLEFVYNEGVAALTDSEPTNTVLARHGDCYLQGALHQAFAFLQDEQRAQYHDALFTRALAEIKKDSDRLRFGTSDLQIRRGASGGGSGLISVGGSSAGTGTQGPQGPAGPAGPAGADGADGADGLGWTGGSYDAGTGIVTFTSDDGLGFSTGDLRGSGSGSGIANVVEDTTPQLGGNLDLNSNDIIGTGDIDLTGTITATSGGSVIPFYFANQAAFPNATTYHGAIAHSHADGAMYFAHGGSWNKLADTTAATTSVAGLMAAADKAKLDAINQSLATTDDVTFNDLVLAGDLQVNGTTTTVGTTNMAVADSLIELSNGFTGTPVNDAGIVIERGTGDNAFMGWDESEDKFVLGTGAFVGTDTGNLTITKGDAALGTLTTVVGGVDIDVRRAKVETPTASADFAGGARLYNVATTGLTFTMDDTALNEGDIITVYANGYDVTIAQDATNGFDTVKLDGTTAAHSGNITVANGSIATISVISTTGGSSLAVVAGQGLS